MIRREDRSSTRLFIALWPDAPIRSEIAATVAALDLEGRITAAANLHVTLVFLGAVDPPRRACIEQALASVEANAFAFTLSRVQWRRGGGMVWLTASDIPAALHDLTAKIHAALLPCGYARETRPYRLHVTAARDVRRFRGSHCAPIHWRVTNFCLVSSTLTSSGSKYAVVRSWPLFQGV